MITDSLLACLQTIRPPANVEEWLRADALTHSSAAPSKDYRQAVYDMLAALGAVSDETEEVTSPMAYYFVQSMRCAVQEKAFDSAIWQGAPRDSDCTGTGARLVHLLEESRLKCSPDPTPLRIVQAVTAVIKARCGNGSVYLMQYDAHAEQFQPIGGKREAFDADNTATLTREICEELLIEHLTPGADFRIHPLVEHLHIDEVSASVHVITRYDHSFYHLTDVRFPINVDENTRWLTEAEMIAHRTQDGFAISSLLDEYMPGGLPTLGYSLPDPIC